METPKWSREFTIEFLDLYRSHPSLWNMTSKDYSNRIKKMEGYEELVNKLREVDENATKEKVAKKIESFRRCFRKELQKIEDSEKRGASFEEIHQPRLWYFNHLSFLITGQVKRCRRRLVVDNEEMQTSTSEFGEDLSSEEPDAVIKLDPLAIDPVPIPCTSTQSASVVSAAKKPKKRPICDDILLKLDRRLGSPMGDEFNVIGENVANKLRKLNPEKQGIAEKLIMDILFEAQNGNINRFTKMHLYDGRGDVSCSQSPINF